MANEVANEVATEVATESLGDRMKKYEIQEYPKEDGHYILYREQPFIARIDGHNFSTFTNGFNRPYDKLLGEAMIKTTADLVEKFNAVTGYTQSDEISLIFMPIFDEKTGLARNYPFNGKIIKLTSLLAGYASSRFNYHLNEIYRNKYDTVYSERVKSKIISGIAHFDARVFSVPNEMEVFNNIFWRLAYDCRRNSISSLARIYFSTKQLHHKNSSQKVEMLRSIMIDYEAYSPFFKYGAFIKREKYYLTTIDQRTNEEVKVTRTRQKLFHLNLTEFQPPLMNILTAKYFPEDHDDPYDQDNQNDSNEINQKITQ